MKRKNNPSLCRSAAAARHPSPHQLLVFGVLAAGLSTGVPTRAAGGNHAVDDASLLEPGQCQFEAWRDRERGGASKLLHAGTACRFGPVELGLNFDRVRLDGDGTTGISGAQVKSARSLRDGWSAAVVLGIAAQDRSPQYLGSTLLIPVTWQTTETLLTHINVGRDFRRGQPDTNRAGLALEWTPLPTWSFVAERFRESGADFWRTGARWSFHPSMSLDISRARSLDGNAPAWWTLGMTWVFDR